MIESSIDLSPAGVGAAERCPLNCIATAMRPAEPSETRGVQAVAGDDRVEYWSGVFVVVGHWHDAQHLGYIACLIDGLSIRIPVRTRLHQCGKVRTVGVGCRQVRRQLPEDAAVMKLTGESAAIGVCCRTHRISVVIDYGDGRCGAENRALVDIAVVPIIEVTKNSVSCARRQHNSVHGLLLSGKNSVPEHKEK